jgi:hypothetical protein
MERRRAIPGNNDTFGGGADTGLGIAEIATPLREVEPVRARWALRPKEN